MTPKPVFIPPNCDIIRFQWVGRPATDQVPFPSGGFVVVNVVLKEETRGVNAKGKVGFLISVERILVERPPTGEAFLEAVPVADLCLA